MTIFTEGQITRAKLAAHYEFYGDVFGDQYTTKLIPGRGSWRPKVVFIGETPTAMEQKTGIAFAGESGKFIARLLADFGIKPSTAYYTYFHKYYLTDDAPSPKVNIPACIQLLRSEMSILDPDVVVPMGILPIKLWFECTPSLSEMVGQVYQRRGHTLIPMWHPAQAVYDQVTREDTERHFKTLADTLLGLHSPGHGKSLRKG